MSAIDQKYTSLGGAAGFLGKATTDETSCPDGVGHYRHFQNGSIYWHPFTGAHEVHGLIRTKWETLGWETSALGYPKTDESASPVGGGRYNQFQGGTILWVPGSTEAFETHGAIRDKWGSLNFESGLLGFPVTDETVTPDGIGRFNHFQHGSVYWKPSIGAHEVHGLISDLWATSGWEKNASLGYPISDELPAHFGSKHRFNDFENGVVYWRNGSAKAGALPKFELDHASKTASEVVSEIKSAVLPLMKVDDRIYVQSGPSLQSVTDYSFDGERARNRRYKIHTRLGIDVPVLPDPWIDLDLYVGVEYAPESRTIYAFLDDWSYHVHVPAGTSALVSASAIGDKLKKKVPPLLGKPQNPTTIPDAIQILSVKVMPNGDLNVYAQPLLDSKS